MRKKVIKIPKPTEYYEYGNPNPTGKLTSDCTVRALAIATRLTWEEAYEILAEAGRRTYTVMDSMEAFQEIMKELHFQRIKIPNIKGKRKPNMQCLSKELKDRIVIGRITGHVMCMDNGKVWDTWNSSEISLRTFWIYTGKDIKADTQKLIQKYLQNKDTEKEKDEHRIRKT